MDRVRSSFPRTWGEICNDPLLAELSCRMEINRRGKIELSPHSRFHSKYQAAIQRLLYRLLPDGVTFQECAIRSKGSTPVADVIWTSHERDDAEKKRICLLHCTGDLCGGPFSEHYKTRDGRKRQEYFDAGAIECWFCDLTGGMTFYGPEGELEQSRLRPMFPKKINL